MSVNDQSSTSVESWGERFTCFTAALCSLLALREEFWWRPLAAGGPFLRVSKAGSLWMFEHAPRPWLHLLGLTVGHAESWQTARSEIGSECAAQGSVLLCADTWCLPWNLGYRKWHGPHWLLLHRDSQDDAESMFVEDPLEMMTPEGLQRGTTVRMTLDALQGAARALPSGNPVVELRERSLLGHGDLWSGARYRWLKRDACVAKPSSPATSQPSYAGADACMALAEFFEQEGNRQDAYQQSDDIWQALRQREFTVAAMEQDTGLLDQVGRMHWSAALQEWRRIPSLLLHARMRAAAGACNPAKVLCANLRRIAEYEGKHLLS